MFVSLNEERTTERVYASGFGEAISGELGAQKTIAVLFMRLGSATGFQFSAAGTSSLILGGNPNRYRAFTYFHCLANYRAGFAVRKQRSHLGAVTSAHS